MRRDRLCLHPLAAAGYHTTCQTINWSLASLRQYEIGRLCRFRLGIMLLRADAAMRWLFSQVSELRAGEMLRLAGYSSGTGVCARGERWGNSGLGAGRFAVIHAGACSSIAVFCLRFTPVFFPLSGKKRRLAVSCVSIPPGRDRHSCVLAALFGYLPWRVHFGLVRLFVAISTGYRRRWVTELAARPLCAFA